MSEMIDRILAAWERLPIRDMQEPGGELDLLRKREAIRAALKEMRNFDTSGFTFTEAEAIRRLFDEALQ